MPEKTFTLPAFAKVNLSLRVLGRRADGYHEIRTIFQTVSLRDELTFSPLADDNFQLACDALGVPADESNLVWRAGAVLRERFGLRAGARVELKKRIPAQGGLGGGSSDAAVALVGLAALWGVGGEAVWAELAELASRLGSDVPFFLTGGTALGTGRGADITPLEDLPRTPLVIVTPQARVPTPEAYRALNAPALTTPEGAVKLPISREVAGPLCEALSNDFEPAVFRLRPEIKRVRDALLRAGARCALLAGSGSSVFGVFESGAVAAAARERLRRRGEDGWQVFACETLPRGDYAKVYAGRGAALPPAAFGKA